VNILTYLSYAPIARGLLVLVFAGLAFPLTGVFILRLNLITLRFTLMHGTLLGGALALGFGLDPLSMSVAVNVLLIAIISLANRRFSGNFGHVTTFLMVITVGIAFAVMYRTGVPAKDTLAILWGNLYAMDRGDVGLTLVFCVFTMAFVFVFFQKLKAVLFDREIAYTSGIHDAAIYNALLVLIGLTVSFAMRLIGALLLDALLLLPAILAGYFAKSLRGLFVTSALIGCGASIAGFLFSLAIDIPASSGITIVAATMLGVTLIFRRIRS
jgi:zinc transport system permease protein